jgi:CRP/FNR family transcriptional regulator, cyclic AMP receptor protein
MTIARIDAILASPRPGWDTPLMARRGDPKVKRLAQVQLFSGCSKRDLTRIAALSSEIDISEGTVLMKQGDIGHEAFVIEKGRAKATVRGKKGSSMGPGECFGEMALLHSAPRSATVTAETDMKLVVLGSREFWTLLEDVPGVALKVLAAVGERLRDNEGKQPSH